MLSSVTQQALRSVPRVLPGPSRHALVGRVHPAHARAYAIWQPGTENGEQRKKVLRPTYDGPPRNEDIRADFVQLVDPVSKALLPAAPLRVILAAMDKDTHWCELVNQPAPPAPPIVRMVSQRDEYQKARKLQAKKLKPPKMVEIQLSWGVDVGDLDHKLAKAKKELVNEGNRVDLVFALKKKSPLPTPDKREDLLNKTMEHLTGVAVEWKPRTNDKAISILHLQRDPSLPPPEPASNKTQSTSPLMDLLSKGSQE
jgi:translation initiation factor IF-3